jgi:two-component system NtrC family sensor kinase
MAQRIDVAQRLAFLGVTEEDRRCLAQLRPVLESQADRIVAALYRRLLESERTRPLLSNPAFRAELIDRQREYLLSLAEREIDDRYVDGRLGIGESHARAGLEPFWQLGACALYLRLLLPAIREVYRGDTALADRTFFALLKTLMLDAELALEAYVERRERELEQLNRELARATGSIRREYEEQIMELRKTAERARAAEDLASVGEIVVGLAHEIGTPIGVIQGYAETLESYVTDESGRARLRSIREQIDRISSVMRALLSIAEPDDRGWSQVELGELIDQALSFLAERFRRAGIRIEREMPLRAVLRGSGERLQQVFLNLFLNAGDAMPDGGTLRIAMSRRGRGELEARVSDTGCGMRPEILGRIFEAFFTTKPAGKGIGLGLAAAKRIVEEHGGTIEVSSEVARGTEFRITLPGASFRAADS